MLVVVQRRRQWQPTPVLLPGESQGRWSLAGCSPRGRWGSDTTERLHFHFLLSGIGEGNGNPLQCSCLENPRDGGAWWAAVYGVTHSRTRLKRLSSSSSGSTKQHTAAKENWAFLINWCVHLPFSLATSVLGIYPKDIPLIILKYLGTVFFWGIICN